MAHTWANALNGKWYNGYVATGTDFSTLDGFITSLVNGDGGGTWTPSSTINIGGSGIAVLGPWTMNGTAVANGSAANPFLLGDSDFFVLGSGHSAASRTIEVQCSAGMPTQVLGGFAGELSTQWEANNSLSLGPSFGTYFQTYRTGSAAQRVPVALVIPLRVHNGATLASVTLTWSVGATHSSLPENLPKWRAVSISPSGVVTPLNSSFTGSYDANGFLLMAPPASASAYNNSGTNYTPVYAVDNNIVINTSELDYAVEIIDEYGPNNALVGNKYKNVLATFTAIPSMQFQT